MTPTNLDPQSDPIGQALAEYMLRVDRGEPVDRERFLNEHVELADQLRQYFQAVETIGNILSDNALDETGNRRHSGTDATVADLPRELGGYVLLEKLGAGGMGEVYRAEHRVMHRMVAIKIIRRTMLDSPDAAQRFQREVRAAARLTHANIVTAYDAGVADGIHFLAMEYVDGRDLASLVKQRGPLPLEQAVDYVVQAARGLEYAHQAGIVHRDVKPSNLLVDSAGTVKILDLGLARLPSAAAEPGELTGSGQVMGTVDYMAPEQARDARHADPRADIYSLGATLWYLLAGSPLYPGESSVQKLLAHQMKPIPSLREACPEATSTVESVFGRMVAKRPEDRYQTMAEAIAGLEQCRSSLREGQGTASAPAPARPSPRRPWWRDGRFLVVAGAAGVLAVLLGVWAIVPDKPQELLSIAPVSVGSPLPTGSPVSTGNAASSYPWISADGRYVAFSSVASNLVSGDTNGVADVFVRDLTLGTTLRVSTDSSGTQATGASSTPSISADGRYVAFSSDAPDMVSGDTNGVGDVFVKDLRLGTTTRVSTDNSGAQANGNSYWARISANGDYVAFQSSASNLVSGDTNDLQDIFVKDLRSGTTMRVSTHSSGAQTTAPASWASISADGRYVAFSCADWYLVDGDTNKAYDVFVKDRSTGTTTRVSTNSSEAQAKGDSSIPSISADGRYVAFYSDARNLVDGGTNGYQNIFVKDRTTGTTTLVSTGIGASQANSHCHDPSISADGHYVAFYSGASNRVSGDTNGREDVFVKDLTNGTTTRVSTDGSGSQANWDCARPSISADGRYVVFLSAASNLVSGDTNGTDDIFVKDRTSGSLRLASEVPRNP